MSKEYPPGTPEWPRQQQSYDPFDDAEEGVWGALMEVVASYYETGNQGTPWRMEYPRYVNDLISDVKYSVLPFFKILKNANVEPEKLEALISYEKEWLAYLSKLKQWVEDECRPKSQG